MNFLKHVKNIKKVMLHFFLLHTMCNKGLILLLLICIGRAASANFDQKQDEWKISSWRPPNVESGAIEQKRWQISSWIPSNVQNINILSDAGKLAGSVASMTGSFVGMITGYYIVVSHPEINMTPENMKAQEDAGARFAKTLGGFSGMMTAGGVGILPCSLVTSPAAPIIGIHIKLLCRISLIQ